MKEVFVPFQTPIAPSFCQSCEMTSRREYWRWSVILEDFEGAVVGEAVDVPREGVWHRWVVCDGGEWLDDETGTEGVK